LCGLDDPESLTASDAGYYEKDATATGTEAPRHYCADCIASYGESYAAPLSWADDIRRNSGVGDDSSVKGGSAGGYEGGSADSHRADESDGGRDVLAQIRQRAEARARRREWCAPPRAADTHFGAIFVGGAMLSSKVRPRTSGPWRGLCDGL
jgi:hypothetical protein